MATISINPQESQDSVTARLRALYPHIPVLPDGVPDQDDDKVLTYPSGEVKPFIILWFRQPKRSRTGRSVADVKLDQRMASVDILLVARSGSEARRTLNHVIDSLVGWKPAGGGSRLVESERTLWDDARSIDIANRPTRWAATQTLDWGLSHKIIP